jgi:hypothetical protein
MTIAEPLASAEDQSLESEIGRNIPKLARTGAAFRQIESGDGEPAAENLGNLLRQVSKPSIGEIDNLISELQTLRRKLQTDGDRIERDIAKYAELNPGNATNDDYLRQREKTAESFWNQSLGTPSRQSPLGSKVAHER